MELDEILGSLAPTGEIPHNPMDIAVQFLLVADRWVREHGPQLRRLVRFSITASFIVMRR